MKLTDMKLPKKDKKDMSVVPSSEYQQEEYPYGLCININNDQLEKLGIFDLVDVDGDVIISAKGSIKRKEKTEMQGGKSDKSLSIQIKMIGVEPEKDLEADEIDNFMMRRNKK